MSTILELVEQGKATRLGAVLSDVIDDLNSNLSEYDAIEVQRNELVEAWQQQSYSESGARKYDEALVDLNERSGAVLDALVAILRAEG